MIYYLNFSVFAQSPTENDNIIQEWKPLNKQNLYRDNNSNNLDKFLFNSKSNNNSNTVCKKNKITKKDDVHFQNSDWEKTNGPFGGSVRQFYNFNEKLYAMTDREVFLYDNNSWKNLNFEMIVCNIIHSMYVYKSGKILVATDLGLYSSDNNGETWESNKINNLFAAIWDIYDAKDGNIILSTTKGIYISNKDDLDFKLLTLKDIYVCTVNMDKEGNIWAGTSTGVLKAKYGEFVWQNMNFDSNYYKKILCDSNNVIYTFSDYKVLKSTDSGNNWWAIQGSYYEDISFDPSENLIITGNNQIFKTNYEGVQWTSTETDEYLLTTFYLTENELLTGTLGAGAFKYNVNVGIFNSLSNGMNVASIGGLLSMQNGELLISTSADSLYISQDNGLSWQSTYKCWAAKMKSSKNGLVYVAANSGLVKSDDFGRSWEKLNINVPPYFISSFDVSDNDKVICAGTSTGEVYVSYDSGKVFQMVKTSDYNFVDAIKILDKNTFIFDCGSLYYTNNGGKDLTVVNDALIKNVTNFVTDNLGYIYLSSQNGIFKSINGFNWSQVLNASNLAFLTTDRNSNIYAASLFGDIYRSTDHGKAWNSISKSSDATVYVSFTTSPNGYLFYGSQDKGLYRKNIDIIKQEISKAYISQNFPNPFNTSTRIEYKVLRDSYVKLIIYDILGKEITTLVSEYRNQGEYYVVWNPSNLPSGIYFYKLQIGNETQTKKMVLLK